MNVSRGTSPMSRVGSMLGVVGRAFGRDGRETPAMIESDVESLDLDLYQDPSFQNVVPVASVQTTDQGLQTTGNAPDHNAGDVLPIRESRPKKKKFKLFKTRDSSVSSGEEERYSSKYQSKEFAALKRYRNPKFSAPSFQNNIHEHVVEETLVSESNRIFNAPSFNRADAAEAMKNQFRYFTIKSIHEEQDRRYLGAGYPIPNVRINAGFDPEKLDNLIRCYNRTIQKLTIDGNVYKYLDQFSSLAEEFMLSEGELNLLVYNFLTEDVKNKYSKKHNDPPAMISSKKFYNNLITVVLGYASTFSSLMRQFQQYDALKSQNPNILVIVEDLNKILDSSPPHQISEAEKDKQLYYKLEQMLPHYMQITWAQLQVPSRVHVKERRKKGRKK